jgi:hypothetical protein
MSGNTRGQQITSALTSKKDLGSGLCFYFRQSRICSKLFDIGKPLASHRRKRAQPGYRKDSFTRSIAGCLRFFTLTQSFDRPPR